MSTEIQNKRILPPVRSLPLNRSWTNEEIYVESLLRFATESDLFRNLCGGVHILDFLTRDPDLYSTVLPLEWREWFELVDVHDVLHLLLQEDLEPMLASKEQKTGHQSSLPPNSLLNYAISIRKHCLARSCASKQPEPTSKIMPRRLVAGMKPKKVHEVQRFSSYIDDLSRYVAEETGEPVSGLVDFGSGQNYLGRTLASLPYRQDVIAIERKHHNVAGAKRKDIYAKLAKKEKIMRNKKEYKRQLSGKAAIDGDSTETPPRCRADVINDEVMSETANGSGDTELTGSLTYIEHSIEDGAIEDVVYERDCAAKISTTSPTFNLGESSASSSASSYYQQVTNHPNLMIISLHSCGNLSHHGLRTLNPSLNPSVSAVAVIGCCYNLLTERLGPATYKYPLLRPYHPRLEATGSTYDSNGFPMSKRLEDFAHPDGRKGLRLNITARMMAVQAPYNWGKDDSEAFFTRHFYRALLQKMLMDMGIVKKSSTAHAQTRTGGSLPGRDEHVPPLIIGSLRKAAFKSFLSYVYAALEKLAQDPEVSDLIKANAPLFTDDTISLYENRFLYARKQLAIMWSLMAFSAGVVESVIVVDRWLWLKEQTDWVGKCWVEPVFDYKHSPRNLVVVGIRRRRRHDGKETVGMKTETDTNEVEVEGSTPNSSI